MNKLEKYLSDPDIINEPMPLREVHAIRLMMQDETVGMNTEERHSYWRKKTDPVIQEFGLERFLVPSPNSPVTVAHQ
jgi:hypothetical protein